MIISIEENAEIIRAMRFSVPFLYILNPVAKGWGIVMSLNGNFIVMLIQFERFKKKKRLFFCV